MANTITHPQTIAAGPPPIIALYMVEPSAKGVASTVIDMSWKLRAIKGILWPRLTADQHAEHVSEAHAPDELLLVSESSEAASLLCSHGVMTNL